MLPKLVLRKITSIIGLGGPFGAKPINKSVLEGKFASGNILVRFLLDGHTYSVIHTVIKLTLNVNKYLLYIQRLIFEGR